LAIHGLNNSETLDFALRPNGCLAAARRIQQRGLARHIGFATHGSTGDILQAITAPGPDGRGFDYVNLHWYYIYQNNWPAILEATRRDMGVFIISPSDKGGMLYKPSPTLAALTRPLHPLVFNDVFCLAQPQVHTLSIGAARPGDFDKHLEALPLVERAAEVLPPVMQRLAQVLVATVGRELANPFTLGLPEWHQTPGNINIPIILWLRNLALAYDLVEYGQMRYNLLGNGGHWFPGLNAGQAQTVNLADLAARSGLGERLVPLLEETHRLLWKAPVQRLSQS